MWKFADSDRTKFQFGHNSRGNKNVSGFMYSGDKLCVGASKDNKTEY